MPAGLILKAYITSSLVCLTKSGNWIYSIEENVAEKTFQIFIFQIYIFLVKINKASKKNVNSRFYRQKQLNTKVHNIQLEFAGFLFLPIWG